MKYARFRKSVIIQLYLLMTFFVFLVILSRIFVRFTTIVKKRKKKTFRIHNEIHFLGTRSFTGALSDAVV